MRTENVSWGKHTTKAFKYLVQCCVQLCLLLDVVTDSVEALVREFFEIAVVKAVGTEFIVDGFVEGYPDFPRKDMC